MRFVRPLTHVVGLVLWLFSSRLADGEGGGTLSRTLWEGLFATVFLYLALLPGPLYAVFPKLPGARGGIQARRALGINAAVFSCLHGYHGYLSAGGLEMLPYWGWEYNLSLALGGIAALILAVLAATSFDRAVAALGRAWKRLHRAVYVAGILILVHAVTVTIHISELKPLLIAWYAALVLLFALEAARFSAGASRTRKLQTASAFFACGAVLFWSTFLIGHHRH
jgi:methionine sulfoxide reductase heme-binding subunit